MKRIISTALLSLLSFTVFAQADSCAISARQFVALLKVKKKQVKAARLLGDCFQYKGERGERKTDAMVFLHECANSKYANIDTSASLILLDDAILYDAFIFCPTGRVVYQTNNRKSYASYRNALISYGFRLLVADSVPRHAGGSTRSIYRFKRRYFDGGIRPWSMRPETTYYIKLYK